MQGYTLFFLFLFKNIDCGYSLEPPRRGGSTDYTHNLCFEQKYEKYQNFLSENFHFLVVISFQYIWIGLISLCVGLRAVRTCSTCSWFPLPFGATGRLCSVIIVLLGHIHWMDNVCPSMKTDLIEYAHRRMWVFVVRFQNRCILYNTQSNSNGSKTFGTIE